MKILKYKDLKTEIQCMWNVKANVLQVIKGATGTISQSFRQYLLLHTGKEQNQGTTKNSHIGH